VVAQESVLAAEVGRVKANEVHLSKKSFLFTLAEVLEV
jgi:hypothetical protein